jgi:nitrite reductase (NO-forming)
MADKKKKQENNTTKTLEERIKHGKSVYMQTCFACHQAEGQGIPGAFPPLAQSNYLNENIDKSIDAVVNGLEGEITVNGEKYNNAMPAQNLSDEEIANVLTFVYNSWGNSKKEVKAEDVDKHRN